MTISSVLDRTKIIGGSDISPVMGLSRWKTRLRLWAEKTGKIPADGLSNFEAAEIGTELEEYVSRKFTRKTGIKLRVDNRTFSHPDHPYMVCHIDRWVIGEDAVFEAKTCSAWKEKEWEGEDIPQEYVLQLNWELGLLQKSVGYIAVLIGGQKFVWKSILFDEHLFQKQVESARVFWEEFVLKDVPPVAMADDNETLGKLYPESKPDTLQFEGLEAEEIDMLLTDRSGAIEAIKHAEDEVAIVEAKIKQKLGEAESGETANYRFVWKTQQRKEFTVKACQFRKFQAKKKG